MLRRYNGWIRKKSSSRRADEGLSFIELLVAIVLLGTAVIGVLTASRATILGSQIERDHSKAQQWLQSAASVLESTDRFPCDLINDPGGVGIQTNYQNTISAGATVPSGWESTPAGVTVLLPKVWNGETFVPYSDQLAGGQCFDTSQLLQQLVTIQVSGPDGRILESVEVVKRDISGG